MVVSEMYKFNGLIMGHQIMLKGSLLITDSLNV